MQQSVAGEEIAAARSRLAAIPGFSEAAEAARIARLPALSNRVYRVDAAGGSFVLRIPAPGTAAIIDRKREETNARAAARIGITPEVLHFGADGVMLMRLVEGAEPLSPGLVTAKPGALERVAAALRGLHDCGAAFAGRFDAFATIDVYAGILARAGRTPTEGERRILDEALAAKTALAQNPPAPKPCHCDPSAGNLLDTDAHVWLVDWEYSGMNDPAWDLAYCSVQLGLSPEAESRLLSAYLGRKPRPEEVARVAVTKAPVELMSALWALIQDDAGNRAADFSAYAAKTFEAAGKRMRSADFRGAIAALGAH